MSNLMQNRDEGKPTQESADGLHLREMKEILSRCKEFTASTLVDEMLLYRIGPESLDEFVIDGVRSKIADLVAREAHRQEAITRSEHRRELATEFRFSGVLMATQDYRFLCKLVRELSQELALKVKP